jgi:hypothetical protein
MMFNDLILIFIKPFILQRLKLADGCYVDQNFFGHKASFCLWFSYKGWSDSEMKKNSGWISVR